MDNPAVVAVLRTDQPDISLVENGDTYKNTSITHTLRGSKTVTHCAQRRPNRASVDRRSGVRTRETRIYRRRKEERNSRTHLALRVSTRSFGGTHFCSDLLSPLEVLILTIFIN